MEAREIQNGGTGPNLGRRVWWLGALVQRGCGDNSVKRSRILLVTCGGDRLVISPLMGKGICSFDIY